MEIRRNEWTAKQFIYAVLMSSLLLDYLFLQAADHEPFPMPVVLALLRLIVSLMGFWLGKLWKDKGFIIMVSFLVFLAIRVAVKNTALFFSSTVSETLFNGIWVVAGCYSVGRILTYKQLRSLFRLLILIWSFGIIVHCSIALYAMWTDQSIRNLSGGSIWGVWYGRLMVGYNYPTIAGSTLCISGTLMVYASMTERSKTIRGFYCIGMIILLIALSLTNARASILAISVGTGVMIYAIVFYKSAESTKKETNRSKRPIKIYLISAVSLVVTAIVLAIAIVKIAPVVIKIKERGSVIISAAKAEEVALNENQLLTARGFDGADILSGRDRIWRNVIRYVTQDPIRLLFGVSIDDPMEYINRGAIEPMAHCHNMIIQLFLESGLTGLVIILLFAIYSGRNALRIIHSQSASIWLRLLLAIPVCILIGDLAECFGWFRQWMIPAPAILFIALGIINTYGNRMISESGEARQ